MSEVWDIANEIAESLYRYLYCKPVSKDRRGRCNPVVIWNFITQAVRLALDHGIEDPKHEIDWRAVIDPFISRGENLAKLDEYFATLGKEKLPLDELDAVAASYIEMERDWIERVLAEEEGRMTPEEREEFLKRLEELKGERERLLGKAKRVAKREISEVVRRKRAEKPKARTLETYFRPTLMKFINTLPEPKPERPPEKVPPPKPPEVPPARGLTEEVVERLRRDFEGVLPSPTEEEWV